MTKKRQPNSSVVSIMDEDNMDLQNVDDDLVIEEHDDNVNYMNMDISTDNIEDIVTEKIGNKMNMDDVYIETSSSEQELEMPKGIAVDDPVRLYLREIGRRQRRNRKKKTCSGKPSFSC